MDPRPTTASAATRAEVLQSSIWMPRIRSAWVAQPMKYTRTQASAVFGSANHATPTVSEIKFIPYDLGLTCSGGANNQCTKCKQANQYILVDSGNVCGTCDTANGKYIDGNYCRSCHNSCKKFKLSFSITFFIFLL